MKPEFLTDDEWAQFNAAVAAVNAEVDRERMDLALRSGSARKLDSGRQPIEQSPLFGGDSQESLF